MFSAVLLHDRFGSGDADRVKRGYDVGEIWEEILLVERPVHEPHHQLGSHEFGCHQPVFPFSRARIEAEEVKSR